MIDFKPPEPRPDFETFASVIKGEKTPEKVHLAELVADFEIVAYLLEKLWGEKMMTLAEAYSPDQVGEMLAKGKGVMPLAGKKERAFWKQYISFFHRMGYDMVTDMAPIGFVMFLTMPSLRVTADTAELSRGQRMWAEEGRGKISSWEDFEAFSWDGLNLDLEEWCDFFEKNTPEGMKIAANFSLFEQVLERLMGYEGLFYSLVDQPDLVKAVFDKWGEITEHFYRQAVQCDAVGMVFHSDDMGYKTATMVSPSKLRELVLPWFKRYAKIAHDAGKMFWLHSCGNVYGIMDDLIDDVKIDAFHSFQDEIMPVEDFMETYGGRVAGVGGLDVDAMVRMDEEALRKRCRQILSRCWPGRFAFGTGNSVTNYIPAKNYLVMLDEAIKFRI